MNPKLKRVDNSKFSRDSIYFIRPNRLFADALDTYHWLLNQDKGLASTFLKKMNEVEVKIDLAEKGASTFEVKYGGESTWELAKKDVAERFVSKIEPALKRSHWWKIETKEL